jgi:hypothetical protein
MTENDDQNHFSPTISIITIAVEVEVVICCYEYIIIIA